MKTSLEAILIALLFIFTSNIFSQDYDPAEIYIYNNSTEVLYVSFSLLVLYLIDLMLQVRLHLDYNPVSIIGKEILDQTTR